VRGKNPDQVKRTPQEISRGGKKGWENAGRKREGMEKV